MGERFPVVAGVGLSCFNLTVNWRLSIAAVCIFATACSSRDTDRVFIACRGQITHEQWQDRLSSIAKERSLTFKDSTLETTAGIVRAMKEDGVPAIPLPVISMSLRSSAYDLFLETLPAEDGQIMLSWFSGRSDDFPSNEVRAIFANLDVEEVFLANDNRGSLRCTEDVAAK